MLLLPGTILMLRKFLSMELKLECSLTFLLNFIVTVPCLPMFYIIALISVTFLLNVIFIPLSADLFYTRSYSWGSWTFTITLYREVFIYYEFLSAIVIWSVWVLISFFSGLKVIERRSGLTVENKRAETNENSTEYSSWSGSVIDGSCKVKFSPGLNSIRVLKE